ncbi:MAG: dihydrodipicolinate synthase family protein [Legionellaceae bacterium]|nr:dihydrodipicolinate synthase family protein [Legionellaceae bacterium]
MNKEIKGVLPVILMPYDNQFDIDENDFNLQVNHLINVGCDGFVIGQVSELLRLTAAERFRLAQLCVESAEGRCVTIMSTGGESIKSAIEFSTHAEKVGIDALLVMHPSIMALGDEEMYKYFSEVIRSVTIPVIVHHAKSLAKRPLSIEVQARLLHEFGEERVMFKPESSPTPPRLSQLRDATQGKAHIFEGDGGMMLLDCYKRGLKGSIPATETAEIMVLLWKLLQKGDEKNARRVGHALSYLMCHMMNSIDCYAAIGKHFLKKRGLIKNTYVRSPIDYVVDPETLREAEATYNYLLELVIELRE